MNVSALVRERHGIVWIGLGLIGSLLICPASVQAQKKVLSEPRDIPGLPVRRQIQIANPAAAAARLFRTVYTDAMPQPGTGSGYVLSPDGERFAFLFSYYNRSVQESDSRIVIQESDGSQRFFEVAAWKKNKPRGYTGVAWSRDGRRLFFTNQGPSPREQTTQEFWSCLLDGTGLRRLPPGSISAEVVSLSPDARRLALVVSSTGKSSDRRLVVLDLASGKLRRLSPTGVYGWTRWSPDSKRLAYIRSVSPGEDDRLEVISTDGKGRRLLISRRALWPEGQSVRQLSGGLLWLSGQFGLLVEMTHALPGYDPGTARDILWQVRPNGSHRRLCEGKALGQTPDGRHILLKLADKFWLVELSSSPVGARR